MDKMVLKKGDRVTFLTKGRLLVIGGENDKRWANGERKIIANFLRTENDFADFMIVISNCFGFLPIKTTCSYGTLAFLIG